MTHPPSLLALSWGVVARGVASSRSAGTCTGQACDGLPPPAPASALSSPSVRAWAVTAAGSGASSATGLASAARGVSVLGCGFAAARPAGCLLGTTRGFGVTACLASRPAPGVRAGFGFASAADLPADDAAGLGVARAGLGFVADNEEACSDDTSLPALGTLAGFSCSASATGVRTGKVDAALGSATAASELWGVTGLGVSTGLGVTTGLGVSCLRADVGPAVSSWAFVISARARLARLTRAASFASFTTETCGESISARISSIVRLTRARRVLARLVREARATSSSWALLVSGRARVARLTRVASFASFTAETRGESASARMSSSVRLTRRMLARLVHNSFSWALLVSARARVARLPRSTSWASFAAETRGESASARMSSIIRLSRGRRVLARAVRMSKSGASSSISGSASTTKRGVLIRLPRTASPSIAGERSANAVILDVTEGPASIAVELRYATILLSA
eukprot:CAMPEP_0179915402 /NCGR_PEP_ID=MMETSP0983-20121128/1645_1 /TAXON_ID=483367 /ORGANISM="non described non described, Strain CCMP 2436" /LENGTH=462 /DNA_ID=CAMNT_0021817797 /DNA_START=98 /DNA_END=1483 /DNA_ORIENTATION=-